MTVSARTRTPGHLIYTLEEGGGFNVLSNYPYEDYLDILKRGHFHMATGDNVIKVVPAYVSYVIGIDDFDFVLDEINREVKHKKNYGRQYYSRMPKLD